MRSLALFVLVACQSSVQRSPPPRWSSVAARVTLLVSDCSTRPSNPGPPEGYHTDIICQADRAQVIAYLVEPDLLGQIQISLAVPIEPALRQLDAALTDLLTADERDLLVSMLRSAEHLDGPLKWKRLPIRRLVAMAVLGPRGAALPIRMYLRWAP